MDELCAAAEQIKDRIVADRRSIHEYPELAYQEHRTAALVADRLTELGIEHHVGVGGTGLVGLIRGDQPGRTVLLRADMDALPIVEATGLPFESKVPGVMHACGHDGHTAMLLGAARLLAARRPAFAGTVKLMFQPAEEGGAGAMRMIDDGLLDDPPVDAAFALHVAGDELVGNAALRPGFSAASADRFTIVVRGRGGHAARPNTAIDPIVVAAQIVIALQTIVSREVPPLESAVVTVGSLNAGTAANIIPDDARIVGTVRAASEEVRRYVNGRIVELAAGIAAAMRATTETTIDWGYPPVVNDAAMTAFATGVLCDLLGAANVHEREPVMGAEDFAFVLQRVPGAFFRLGVRDPAWPEPRLSHSARFELAEDALPVGAAALAALALRFLDGH